MIIGNDLLGPFLIKKGVKINSQSYCALLKKFLIPWIKCQNKTNLKELVFQQDNAPAHSSKQTKAWLNANNIKVMKWPPCSPDLNPIENFWSILKLKIYKNGRQFKNNDELWEEITKTANKIDCSEIKAF